MSDKRSNRNIYRRIVALVTPYLWTFFLGMLALAGGAAVNLLFPEIIRRLINSTSATMLVEQPLRIGTLLVLLFAAQGMCFYFRSYLFGIVGQRVVARLRRRLFAALMEQDVQFFDERRTGDLVSRLNADAQLIQDAVSIKLSVIIRYTLQVAFGILFMLLISVRLTLAILLVLPPIVALSIVLGKKLKRCSKEQQAELGRATVIAEETIAGNRIVKAFSQEEFEINRFSSAVNRVLQLGLDRAKLSAFLASFVSFLMNAAIVFVLLYGMTLVFSNSLSAGDLTAFLMYGLIVAVSLAFVSNTFAEVTQAAGAAERVFEILDSAKSLPEAQAGAALKESAGALKFQSVAFAYPSRQDLDVLKDISFDIRPGQRVALVGPSGAGKSTIVNLILRFYEPTAGKIFLDGTLLSALNPQELRACVAYVPQEPVLFAVSIAENLRYGKRAASEDELNAACKQANILSFIETLPEGFNTFVGERGVQLSAGQKQRLAIARAILRDPKLLLLDEATSALDSENEQLVQEALDKLMSGRSALVIAHRLSTVMNADLVLVIDQGKIVQRGTHAELSRSPGLYQDLVERQGLVDSMLENRVAAPGLSP